MAAMLAAFIAYRIGRKVVERLVALHPCQRRRRHA